MSAQPRTPLELVKLAAEFLDEKGVPGARLDAEILLARILQCSRVELYTQFERPLQDEEVSRYRDWIRRRSLREPVSRILGEREFMGIRFSVTEAVLSPRPDTEILVEEAIRLYKEEESRRKARDNTGRIDVLDLGTGSGCIAVSLAAHCPSAKIVATDISPRALEVARHNALGAGVWERLDFREGDFFDACWTDETFDLICSNPPYIAEGDPEVWPEVRDYDPPEALYAGKKGLDFFYSLVVGVGRRLRPGGSILLEVGKGQAEIVQALLREEGGAWDSMRVLNDHAGVARVVVGRRAG